MPVSKTLPPPKPLVPRAGRLSTWWAACVVWGVQRLSARGRAGLASAVGAVAYHLGIRRRVTLDNLRQAFPEKSEADRRRIARGAYRNMALAALEALGSSRLTDAQLEEAVIIENWEPFERALSAGTGLLAATAHFGSWELFGEVMARRGIVINAVVRPLQGALNAKIIESRLKSGLRLILQRGALAHVVKAARRGEAVAQLIDQVLPARHAVFVPFFGRPAATTPALTVAAMRTGAPVFVVMAAREGDRLRMFAEGPVPVPQTGDRARDIEAHVAALTAIIERYIRRYPDQWLWLHRRWKVQPPKA